MNLQTTNYKPASPAGRLQTKQGFSLIELLVSVAILVVVSGLVFFNQSGFNNSVLLENLAYEISLTIRQAQSYGLQSKETEIGGTFEAGYGVYFTTVAPNNNLIILYADDVNVDKEYTAGSDTIIDTLKMATGNTVIKLCADSICDLTELDVSFIRPNPTAYINEDKNIGEIYIESPREEQRKILINRIGQISID